jgi:hypothetical protein
LFNAVVLVFLVRRRSWRGTWSAFGLGAGSGFARLHQVSPASIMMGSTESPINHSITPPTYESSIPTAEKCVHGDFIKHQTLVTVPVTRRCLKKKPCSHKYTYKLQFNKSYT